MSHKKTVSTCLIAVIVSLVFLIPNRTLRTTEQGLLLIANAEGCLIEPYHCPAGLNTVGIGHTSQVENRTYTANDIAELYYQDVLQAERCVNQFAQGEHLPLSVFEATTSIVFNVGCQTMRQSSLFRHLNHKNYQAACAEFPRWKYANGKVLKGLVIRRQNEEAHCLRDVNE